MSNKVKMTPMMKQYQKVKDQYPDAFLFYRLGDFYEMFNDDAVKGAHLLELTLTARNRNTDHSIPMCGVPHRSVNSYVNVLIDKGYKVAICEQMEDPKEAKGMVKRAVVQLVTPGTQTKSGVENAKNNNYLTALIYDKSNKTYGFAYADLSTGELKTSELTDIDSIFNEIIGIQTKEIVVDNSVNKELIRKIQKVGILVSHYKNKNNTLNTSNLTKNLTSDLEKSVVNYLLNYVINTQKRNLSHLQVAVPYEPTYFLKMDHNSKYNLELIKNIRTGKKAGTLLWLLDNTKTAMGGRKLKRWLNRPLIDHKQIIKRQNAVEGLLNSYFERSQLRDSLVNVYDLERLAGRVAFGSVNGRDLIQLKTSLQEIPKIKYILNKLNYSSLKNIYDRLDPVSDITDLIDQSISNQPPISVTDGAVIKDNYNRQLDKYRDAMRNGKRWMADLEAKERKNTGINNLKVGYNHVFGYYIEVTKVNLNRIPKGRYQRKQTLRNAERFSTPELKDKENLILESQEKSKTLEYEIFVKIRDQVKDAIQRLQSLADSISTLDVLQSFAQVSEEYRLIKPSLTDDHDLKIIDGRHPVVEKVLGHQSYVPNSILMPNDINTLLITGPNMSGKSTYMRQLALIVIMSQIGCFIPAKSAKIPVFDQIFTRIGATDDLISGQSTFMVEMQESNNALQHATKNSLILFDELGRGTATYDGMALAQSIIEYVHNNIHAKTLFSTHYHELTILDKKLSHLKNVHVGATERNGELVFLHKVEQGAADKSYGIHVAKLAGLPDNLLKRANFILNDLESKSAKVNSDYDDKNKNNKEKEDLGMNKNIIPDNHNFNKMNVSSTLNADEKSNGEKQLALFNTKRPKSTPSNPKQNKVLKELNTLDLMSETPMEIMNKVYKWKQQIKKS